MQPVISNNSPLVGLLGLDLLFLLRDLYTEVWIPRKIENVIPSFPHADVPTVDKAINTVPKNPRYPCHLCNLRF